MPPPLFLYAGHHKALTTFLRQVFVSSAERLGWRHAVFSDRKGFGEDLPSWFRANPVDLLVLSNAELRDVLALGKVARLRGLHVGRDPRDIVVSAYFSHRFSHSAASWPRLAEHRRRLAQLDEAEGLMAELEFSRPNLERMGAWAGRPVPELLEIPAERVMLAPADVLLDAARESDLVASRGDPCLPGIREQVWRKLGGKRHHLAAGEFLALVQRYGFRAVSGRVPGEEDVSSHQRRGTPGDWRRAFGPAHRDRFRALYGDLAERLGYPAD